MEKLTEKEKSELRTAALRMAKEINPNLVDYSQSQWGLGSQKYTPPTIEKLLKDAQTIYKWLLEGETNFEADKR